METQIKRLRGELNEAKIPLPKFDKGFNGHDIIDLFDGISSLKKYRNKSAQYDDAYFTFPIEDWNKLVGWSKQDVKKINSHIESYEGGIEWYSDEVFVTGGA